MNDDLSPCGYPIDELLAIDPFLCIKDTGGSNSEDDVALKSVLRTQKFWVDLEYKSIIPKKLQRIYVIERIMTDNYDNLFMHWHAITADGVHHNPYYHIPFHETDHNERHQGSEFVNAGRFRVEQGVIDKFRKNGTEMLSVKQRQALGPKPKRRLESFEPTEKVDIGGYCK